MTTDQKGAIAETAITAAAVRLGIGVWRPVVGGERYDLIFDVHRRLLKVQCKWAVRRGEAISVRCYSSGRTRGGFVKQPYSREEIDALAAYCPDLDCCHFLPLERFPPRILIQLRLSPARNNQVARVNWAADYAFEALDWNAYRGP